MSPTDEWYSQWFNSTYYHILYQDRDYAEAQFFIDQLIARLQFAPQHRLLDLACGKGRHAIYLHEQGFEVLGVDLSPQNIAFARQFENERLQFRVQDMREVFAPESFDFVLNLFTSFGYFEAAEDDLRALRAVFAQLKPGGQLLLDFLNPVRTLAEMKAYELKTKGGIDFEIRKSLQRGFIVKDICFRDQGQAYHFQERVRALDQATFLAYFEAVGFNLVHLWGNYALSAYEAQVSERMIFLVEKPRIC
ncbi:MAG: class I SAM-dependent methyltransferase [Microscillaceae bacterium]|nr:class I SAM-dependent methyltransferase [Microscillaceae bacterium]